MYRCVDTVLYAAIVFISHTGIPRMWSGLSTSTRPRHQRLARACSCSRSRSGLAGSLARRAQTARRLVCAPAVADSERWARRGLTSLRCTMGRRHGSYVCCSCCSSARANGPSASQTFPARPRVRQLTYLGLPCKSTHQVRSIDSEEYR